MAITYTQANRRIAIETPLGDDVLLLRGFAGTEAISHFFRFDLSLNSENDSIALRDLVGKSVTVRVIDENGNDRPWNGFISRFSQGHRTKSFTAYYAEMVPWLWFLTRTADCRIFQKKKVPDIIKQVFDDLGFKDYEFRIYGSFAPREYCVQYRETDFNFVARLMEEEGICYYFRHEPGKHVLVMANDPAGHDPCPEQAKARYDTRDNVTFEDVITELRYDEEFRSGAWAHTDYNFETPSTNLAVTVKGGNPLEIYDYPGEYDVRSEGDRYARIRLEEQTAAGTAIEGGGSCRHFCAGFTFTLEDYYRPDLNQSYLLTSVQHKASLGIEFEPSDASGEKLTYQNTFRCLPGSIPFRPPRITPHPRVHGCQTAVVVGPAGEEIYTDKHGRVKVQFHWDRDGKRNENSSCWVRVSHPWAGQGWGAISIPRIGQEVIVDFLEGDPDQPIIVGRVYNAEQMPPFGMPGGAVISGVRSNSTKGGGGYNEISLDDTKGTELINIHAQYDQQKKVEHDERVDIGNDRTEHVGHNEKITIDNNRTEKVGVNENITIGSNRTESVGANESITIGANRTENVGAHEAITVALTRTRNVGINEMVNIGAAQEITIGGLQVLSVGAARAKSIGAAETVTVGANQSVSIGVNQSINVGGNQSITVGGNRKDSVSGDVTTNVGGNAGTQIGGSSAVKVGTDQNTNVGQDAVIQAGKKLTLIAGDEILIKAGSASISMKKNGDILIKGKKLEIKGDSSIKLKASKITEN